MAHGPGQGAVHGGLTTMATGRGVHGESISGLTEAWAVARRPGDGGEEMVEQALGAGSA
jgi:hypothetical protein